jgi:hypothetical protein
MKTMAYVALIVGVISLIIGVVSRLTLTPLILGVGGVGGGLGGRAFLAFTNTCLLIAITFILLEILKAKK